MLSPFFIIDTADTTLRKTKWFKPYIRVGKAYTAAFKGSWNGGSGVYFIRNAQSKEVVYVGHSRSQIKKTIYRHFQDWSDRQRNGREFDRVTYCKNCHWEVKLLICPPEQAARAEIYFIRKLKPRDNPTKYNQLSFDDMADKGKKVAQKFDEAETIPPAEFLDLPF